MHSRFARTEDMHPIHSNVALAVIRTVRDHFSLRNEASAVFGPAYLDWQVIEGQLRDDFLRDCRGNRRLARPQRFSDHASRLPDRRKLWRHHLFGEADQFEPDLLGITTERHVDAILRCIDIDRKRKSAPFYIFKEQSRLLFLQSPNRNLRYLEP